MKSHLTKLFIAACLVSTTALTACFSDDDDYEYVYVPLTQEERSAQINAMQGYYDGKIHYFRLPQYSDVTDSIDTQWRITAADSLLRLDIPLQVFRGSIYELDLQEAMKASTKSFEVFLSLYRPIGTTGTLTEYYYAAVPRQDGKDYEVTLPLTINGEEKNVTFIFDSSYANTIYSAGIYENGTTQLCLVLKEMRVAGEYTHTVNTYIYIKGTKSKNPPIRE